MADPRKVYVGEVKKRIKVKVGISLAGVSTMTLLVEKPDGSTAVSWTASRLGDAQDGWVYYDTQAGDLDNPGIYRIHSKLVFADGRILYGERTWFQVYTPSEG